MQNSSYYGIGGGIARGGVPSARISVYKACDGMGCADSNILGAFDDAIADGVDIISISIGGFFPISLHKDGIVIGSFHAMEKGVLTIQGAGNSGSYWKATYSTAPWTLSAAASSIDRKFVAKLGLMNESSIITVHTLLHGPFR